jgi:hypothetical protein
MSVLFEEILTVGIEIRKRRSRLILDTVPTKPLTQLLMNSFTLNSISKVDLHGIKMHVKVSGTEKCTNAERPTNYTATGLGRLKREREQLSSLRI